MDENQLMDHIAQSLSPDSSPSPIPMPGVPVEEITEIQAQDEKPVVMTDDEITSILDAQITGAQDWIGSTIQQEQAKAMEYYLGLAEGDLAPPEVNDRSAVVDTVVSDQIEWLMPSLMEIMFASGQPVKFCPRKPGDEDGADQMTALVNHIVNDLNPGFEVFESWFKTALLSKIGIAKVWWCEETERTQESYAGLTDGQFAVISDDPEVTISSVKSYVDPYAERAAMDQFRQQATAAQNPPMPGPPGAPPAPPPQAPQPIDISKLPQLHDVVVTISKKAGKVAIDSLNPEDFLIAEASRRIDDGFCAHRIKKTRSELRAAGYKNVDDITSDSNAQSEDSELFQARNALQDQFSPVIDEWDNDPSQRIIWLYECYLKIDCDGDGISEWRKITKAGNKILDNEICDGPPFAALTPVPIPGLFYGRSIADLAMPMQRLSTNILRGLDDNMRLQINGRTWAVENQVNMEDLLTNRPGGIVRVKNAQAVGPLQQGMADSAGAYQFLQYVDTMKQERTGVTKYSQGLDSDTLNHTATGIENITQRADLRVKLLARRFAETGMKELFRLIQKVLMNYQDQNMAFQLNGKWVDVDPRVWRNQYSMTVTVGTGTGDTGRRVAQLTQLLGTQVQLMQMGVATPENLYKTASELVKALQLGEPSMFFTEPPPPPPPGTPPPPNPQVQMFQAQQALEKEKFQGDQQLQAQKAQMDQQTQLQKIQAQAQADQHSAELKAQVELSHQQLIDQRTRDQMAQQFAWEREKFMIEQETSRINAAVAAKATSQQESALDQSVGNDLQSEA